MRLTKWIFFGYLAFIGLLVAGIAISFARTNPRDPSTLYSVYYDNIKSMDPAICNDTVGSTIIGNVYETLYSYKYGVRPYELYPQLAAEMPQVSADSLTYTVRLRHGIHFYDPYGEAFPDHIGPEMHAADVIYSWKRVADFHLASPNYSTLFQGRIAGIDEWNQYSEQAADGQVDYGRPVAGLTALDEYTLRIQLTQPSPQFKYLMAYLGTAVVPRRAVEVYGDRFNNRPVGTGPYAMQEHSPEQRIIFVANPSYRGAPDIDGGRSVAPADRLPRISRLQYEYFKDFLPAWYLFREKLFDLNVIPKEAYEQAIDPRTLELRPEMVAQGMELDKSPQPSIFYVGFNMGDPVVGKNKALRQAMSMAFDRARYVQIYENGRGLPANGIIPPTFPTFDPQNRNPYTRFDLAAARQLMKKAVEIQHGRIPPLKMQVGGTDTEQRQDTEFFVSQMQALDVEIIPEYSTWARFQELVDGRQTQVFSLGWDPDYPDEQTFLQLFYGKFAPPGGINPTAYDNPKYDALYEKAMVMERSPERDDLYRKMEAIVNEDCVWICQYYPVIYTLQYNWLNNAKTMDYGTGYRQYFALDSARRQKVLGLGR